LLSPYAEESYSPVTGASFLAVDLRVADAEPSEAALARACVALARLPCTSVAIRAPELAPATEALAGRFDVVADESGELPALLDAIRRAPLAATALMQLLRHSEGRDVHDGLIAESLVFSTLQAGPEFEAWIAERTPGEPGKPPLGPAVLAERRGDLLELTLNRPRRHNAFSAEMRDALVEALRVVVGDPSIAEVVVRGAGASFCSGGDLVEFGSHPDPSTAHAIRSTRNAARLLADCAGRLRFEVHGACVGAGVELPAFAARVEATKDAYFQLPEVGMGLVPGAGGTVSLPRRIGRQRTAKFALTGQRIDAQTAKSWGLVDVLRA
jgi:enoyl-CoA hydratase/carnithine racemase